MNSVLVGMSCSCLPYLVGMTYSLVNFCSISNYINFMVMLTMGALKSGPYRPVCGRGVPCISREVRSGVFLWSIIRCILEIRMLELYQMRQKWSIRPIFGLFRAQREDPYKLIFLISSNSKMNMFIELATMVPCCF